MVIVDVINFLPTKYFMINPFAMHVALALIHSATDEQYLL